MNKIERQFPVSGYLWRLDKKAGYKEPIILRSLVTNTNMDMTQHGRRRHNSSWKIRTQHGGVILERNSFLIGKLHMLLMGLEPMTSSST